MPRRSPRSSPDADALDIELGQAIRRFRKASGLSQHGLAARLSLSGQQLQKYESAANRVSASALWRIARELDQPVAAFFPPDARHDPGGSLAASAEGRALAKGFLGMADMGQRRALALIALALGCEGQGGGDQGDAEAGGGGLAGRS